MVNRRWMVLAVATLTVAAVASGQNWLPDPQTSGPIYYNGGNVGIGTSSPSSLLHIFGGTTLVSSFQVATTHNGNAGGTNIGLQVAPIQGVAGSTFAGINAQVDQYGASSGTVDVLAGLIAAARHWDSITVTDAYGAKYVVANRGAGTMTRAAGAYISDAQNNGGGTITTQYGLYLENQTQGGTNYAIYSAGGNSYFAGNMTVAGTLSGGNIAATYQDLAEWVPAREDLAPGTVVVIDPQAINHVMASGSAYDTMVAGVVSAQPGLILGEAGDEKSMVATTGRVKVRVDATKGPIAIGDLLVTSDKPGTAMRSEPMEMHGRKFHQPGTLIGKALEPLAEGEGEILVLLSLQ